MNEINIGSLSGSLYNLYIMLLPWEFSSEMKKHACLSQSKHVGVNRHTKKAIGFGWFTVHD